MPDGALVLFTKVALIVGVCAPFCTVALLFIWSILYDIREELQRKKEL